MIFRPAQFFGLKFLLGTCASNLLDPPIRDVLKPELQSKVLLELKNKQQEKKLPLLCRQKY